MQANPSVGNRRLENDALAKVLNGLDDPHLPQYALPLHFEHLRNFTSGLVWSLPQVLQRRRFVMVRKGLDDGIPNKGRDTARDLSQSIRRPYVWSCR